ncbi:hypothetical protein LguiB_032859 [Lonicera macranthoides]
MNKDIFLVELNDKDTEEDTEDEEEDSDQEVDSSCRQCSSETDEIASVKVEGNKLNNSQDAAVLSSIAKRECCHQNTIKLIWGPPGTGKTKTVALLLFAMLKMRCRTLKCAPSNIVVVGVCSRLLSLVRESLEHDSYGLEDIVLFGNRKRLKINYYDELCHVLIDRSLLLLR